MVMGLLIVLVAAMSLSGVSRAATVAYWRFEAGPADTNVQRPEGVSDYTFSPDVPDVSGNGNHLAVWTTGGGCGFAYRADVPLTLIPQTWMSNNFSIQNTGNWPAAYTKSESSAPVGIDIEGEDTFAQFTIEAFYKCTTTSKNQTFVGRDGRNVSTATPDRAALYFQLWGGTRVAIQFADVAGYWHEASSPANSVQTNRWYYYAAVSDGATLSLYMADVEAGGELQLVAQTDMTASGSPNTTLAKGTTNGDDWHAGGWSVGRGLWAGGHTDRALGFIDEVRISNTALNVNQLLYSPGLSAWDPDPADGQTGVPLDVDLSWKTGQDPKNIDQQNPDITHHYLYFRHDPNFLEMTEPTAIIAADGPSASYHISGLLRDKTYYWRVDEILNNGPAGDPNFVISGNVWQFSTILSAPTIPSNGHPTNLLVYPGADAVVKLRFTSYSPASVTWHRYVDGENDIALNDKFGNVIDPIKYAVETDMSSEAQLTIYNAVADDEGYYYAVVSNAEQMSVQSKMARLAVRRLVAYFPMEIIENGATSDVESGYSLTLANDLLESNLATLAAGVDELGGNSLLLSNTVSSDPNFYGQYGVIEPGVVDYEDLTIAAWVMWNGGADWQRIFDFGNDTNQYMFLTPKAGTDLRFAIKNSGTEQVLNTAQLTANQWYHVVVTLDGNTGRLYVNGELKATNTAMTINPIDFKPTLNYIGKSQFAVDPYFNGRIDDLKIYNYARTVEEVAQDYLAVRGEWICDQSLPALTYDFDGNCRVDLSDFAIFASEWLQSNRIYPEQ
jgi:hypothetical protein